MSSYYNTVSGTLQTGRTARVDDINLIQAQIKDMIRTVIIDMFGTGFILGESENALKLYASTLHTDQVNKNYDSEGYYWISFYDRYFRQPIDITKSSIETVRVHMINDTNITTTVYAEILDSNGEHLQEANAILSPTYDDNYAEIDFHFNLEHLPVGRYFFVIRPVDISATDLARNGDETDFDIIEPEDFCIRYDNDGNYNKGLEISYDGSTYIQASKLEEVALTYVDDTDDDLTLAENNPDLYFEEIFSSGQTFLIDDEFAAVVMGEKVYPLDTHVTIDNPSIDGDRVDLITLTRDGQLVKTTGKVYTNPNEKEYPINSAGLNVAYITSFKASSNKVPAIEQDDDNGITRVRDVLERLRRVEKKIDYQIANNSVSRVQYFCDVDPILSTNDAENPIEIKGEGTYGMSTSTNDAGNTIATNNNILNFAWSIIKNNYTYNVETKTTENGEITVWDTYTTSKKDKHYTTNINGLYRHHIEVKDHSTSTPKPVSGLELKVQVKKGGTLKKTYTVTTNKNGNANVTFFALNLAKGNYSIYTIYKGTKLKSKLVVVDEASQLNGKSPKTHNTTLSIPKVSGTSVTNKLPTGVIPGDDSFYKDNVDVDVQKGEVRVKKISSDIDNYEINNDISLLKDTKAYKSSSNGYQYTIGIAANKNDSHFPALTKTFNREIYIKSITPYLSSAKNIKSVALLIFKNEITQNKKNNRKYYTKKIGSGAVDSNNYDDKNFPTLYKSEYISIKNLLNKDGAFKKQITFDNINLDCEIGTYTIMICPKLKDTKKKGYIEIKEFDTKNDSNKYGFTESISGNNKLSKVYINTTGLRDTSWDVAIKHKTYKYYDKGILQSRPINIGINFSSCSIKKNFVIPKNCNAKLYVSNNGGTSWVEAKTNNVTFASSNTSFRWKVEMTTNNISTPKLKFNQSRGNAISFSLNTSATDIEYEDYGRCYETPLLNANHITRTYTRSIPKITFTEWEFARIFMEDEEFSSKIDILISYADEDYVTSVTTPKSDWQPEIFFSTVFADLTLEDFSHESIDYDNYESNVEYDENNYRFSLNSAEMSNQTGMIALAYPTEINSIDTSNTNIEYVYGDINRTSMSNCFTYEFVGSDTSPYRYYGNEGDSTLKYTGMHIEGGPYVKATKNTTGTCTEDDTVIGIRFNNGLDINENVTHLIIGLFPHAVARADNSNVTTSSSIQDDESIESKTITYFPAGTFKISVSLDRYGNIESDSPNVGKEFIIDHALVSDKYQEFNIDFINDLEGYSASDINSIGIHLCNPEEFSMITQMNGDVISDQDFIGIGRLSTWSYNSMPYTPYMYTGKHHRLQWKNIVKDESKRKYAQAYSMYSLGTSKNNNTSHKVFYPIDHSEDDLDDINNSQRTIKSYSFNNESASTINLYPSNNKIQIWRTEGNGTKSSGTSRRLGESYEWKATGASKTYIKRENSQIHTFIDGVEYITQDTGNQILFQFPGEVTGNIFKIDLNIPYTIYDLIDIEYYIASQYWKSGDTGYSTQNSKINTSGSMNIVKNKDDNNIYATDGAFSKGEIIVDLYDTKDIDNNEPVESFALPAWGRIATRSYVKNKVVHAFFKKRNNVPFIRCMVLRRANPRQLNKSDIRPLKLLFNDMAFFNSETQAALGPQMQMRIYPKDNNATQNVAIRKIGGIYRL